MSTVFELNADLDEILSLSPIRLQEILRQNNHIHEPLFESLLRKLGEILHTEPNVLYLDAPITVCGDIHGQLLDLFSLFETSGNNFGHQKYLFLGDYVDRGYSSLETFLYLAFLKIKYSNTFFILRGNHESRQVNQMYGLFQECANLYGHGGSWHLLNDVFDLLPIAAVIDNRIFCVHGGLSPHVKFVEQIFTFNRRKEIETDDPIADLTWSDPENVPRFGPGRRGIGHVFGPTQTKQFLHNNRLGRIDAPRESPAHGFIARAHQIAHQGFAWLHEDGVVIVWSAPNYMYTSGNIASVMKVDPRSDLRFQLFDKDPASDVKPPDATIEYFA
jgi:diadenosine tetraphosphatase ApaH/serine/threonine PP2A family protein phosphatase